MLREGRGVEGGGRERGEGGVTEWIKYGGRGRGVERGVGGETKKGGGWKAEEGIEVSTRGEQGVVWRRELGGEWRKTRGIRGGGRRGRE